MRTKPLIQQSPLTELQNTWYDILKTHGFDDIEDSENEFILKSWSGISHLIEVEGKLVNLIDLHYSQPPLKQIITSFQEPLMSELDVLLNHSRLNYICERICSHGNHSLKSDGVKQILTLHIDGQTERFIGKKLNINDTLVHRTITALTTWAKVMTNEETQTQAVTVKLRPFDEESDIAFVYSTWRNALWFDKDRPQEQAEQFYRAANKRIKHLLAKPGTVIKVACLEDDPNLIAGYAVFNEKNLEWVYIKINYRKQGIARILTKGLQTVSFPLTKVGEKIASKKKLKIQGELGDEDNKDLT